jgi:tRNA uridine 5-carboxymethylaminomethyl modification enzyme
VETYLIAQNSTPLSQKVRLRDLCLRPELSLKGLIQHLKPEWLDRFSEEVFFAAELAIKYSGYIEREKIIAEKLRRLDELTIPADFDYGRLNISTEAKQKLTRIRPASIGQASRIPGVSPADINALLIYMGR